MAKRQTSTAKAVAAKPRARSLANPPPAKREAKPKPEIIETLEVPSWLLLAAESVAAKADKQKTIYHGVLIHQVDAKLARVVACDGPRLFVGSFPTPRPISWLKQGLILDREALKTRVTMLQKTEGADWVSVSYAAGASKAELSDGDQRATMRAPIRNARFPDYTRHITDASFTTLNPDPESVEEERRDWETVGYNARSLRYCADIAKILQTSMAKAPKDGIVIRAYSGTDGQPKAFDFPEVPGALLMMMPVAAASQKPIQAYTAPLLANAARLTVAALRAHATRWRQRAAETEDEREKQEALDRAAGFDARVEAVIAKAPSFQAQLEGPAQSPAEPEAQEPQEPDEEDEEAERRTVH